VQHLRAAAVGEAHALEGHVPGDLLERPRARRVLHLHLLVEHADDPFWVVSADIHAPGFGFDRGASDRFAADARAAAHLWLGPNPPFHPRGDFGLAADGRVVDDAPGGVRHTYANLALCRPAIVAGVAPGMKAALGPLLYAAARAGRVTGELWRGAWENVGTPAQLAALNAIAPPAR